MVFFSRSGRPFGEDKEMVTDMETVSNFGCVYVCVSLYLFVFVNVCGCIWVFYGNLCSCCYSVALRDVSG